MGALSGLRVLDLSIIVQGPQAAAMLHDLGADVVKVELPGLGDLARYITIHSRNGDGDMRSGFFYACNRGKRSVTLDLRTVGGKRALIKLVEQADVMISNFMPGTLDGWGLGYDVLSEVNPRLIYAAGSAFGPSGPDAQREGADIVGQAMGGLISTTGLPGTQPTPVAAVVADHSGSQNMVIGILAALHHRERTGRGQRIEVSLLGAMIWAQASEYSHYLLSGQVPGRSNRGHPMIKAVYRMFPTADGHLVMAGVPLPSLPALYRAVGKPELAEDPRFMAMFMNPADLEELFVHLDEGFKTKTTSEWTAVLRADRQRFAPVYDYAQLVADPQPWENGYFMTLDHPEWGPTQVVGAPISMSETPLSPGVVVPELGQHTEEVLLEAGFSWDEIEALRRDGAF